jgi:hypothetical protein
MESTKGTIEALWMKSEKELLEVNKERALKALQREAEIVVADLASKAEDTDAGLERAIVIALKDGSKVANLFELKRAAKIAKAKHADALADYKEFFGSEPKLQ